MKRCSECGNAIGNRVFIANGRIYCAEHDPSWKADASERSPVARWFIYLLLVVFALLIVGSAKAAVSCASDVLCKDEVVKLDSRSYICSDPLVAIDIANTHKSEGLMKAKSHWDKAVDGGGCISYDNMDGTVGELILDVGVVRVVSFEVGWPKKKVYLLTQMKWSAGITI